MARLLSMPGSGSVKHPSKFTSHWALQLLSNEAGGFKMLKADLSRLLLTLGLKNLGWLSRLSDAGDRASNHSPFPPLILRPESRQDYPPNLSILISGGKENNCDALSNGE